MKREINTASDLRSAVEEWVNSFFNFVQLEVLEKMAGDGTLCEYIRQPKPDYDEFMNNYRLWDGEYEAWLEENEYEDEEDADNKKEFCEQHSSFDRWNDEQSNDNYPMWNTCFEFRHSESEDVVEAAERSGFGIIEGLEPFETILFVSGCGYSFYGAHWIPMYLNLPWNQDIKQEVEEKGIKYSNQ